MEMAAWTPSFSSSAPRDRDFSIFLHGKAGPIKGADDKTEVLSVQIPDHLGGVIGHGQHIVQPELLTDADRRLMIFSEKAFLWQILQNTSFTEQDRACDHRHFIGGRNLPDFSV